LNINCGEFYRMRKKRYEPYVLVVEELLEDKKVVEEIRQLVLREKCGKRIKTRSFIRLTLYVWLGEKDVSRVAEVLGIDLSKCGRCFGYYSGLPVVAYILTEVNVVPENALVKKYSFRYDDDDVGAVKLRVCLIYGGDVLKFYEEYGVKSEAEREWAEKLRERWQVCNSQYL